MLGAGCAGLGLLGAEPEPPSEPPPVPGAVAVPDPVDEPPPVPGLVVPAPPPPAPVCARAASSASACFACCAFQYAVSVATLVPLR